MKIKKRARWKRIAMWPLNFFRVYRIKSPASKIQKITIAFYMANLIAK